jgi:hypothetical protein
MKVFNERNRAAFDGREQPPGASSRGAALIAAHSLRYDPQLQVDAVEARGVLTGEALYCGADVMADDRELVQILVQTLRRIEADADSALQRGDNLHQALRDIRDAAGNIAADAANRIEMTPHDAPDKST